MAKTPQNAPKRAPGKTRELVLKQTVAGRSPRQIATRLGISTQAVYVHLHNLEETGELLAPPKGNGRKRKSA